MQVLNAQVMDSPKPNNESSRQNSSSVEQWIKDIVSLLLVEKNSNSSAIMDRCILAIQNVGTFSCGFTSSLHLEEIIFVKMFLYWCLSVTEK